MRLNSVNLFTMAQFLLGIKLEQAAVADEMISVKRKYVEDQQEAGE